MAPYSRDHVDVHWQSPLSTLSTSRRRRYAVAISQGNAQAALAFQFLHEIVKVLRAYFGDFTEVLDAFSWGRARVLFLADPRVPVARPLQSCLRRKCKRASRALS